jgi:hypothetical protein
MPLRFVSFQKFFGGAAQPQVSEILCSKSVDETQCVTAKRQKKLVRLSTLAVPTPMGSSE